MLCAISLAWLALYYEDVDLDLQSYILAYRHSLIELELKHLKNENQDMTMVLIKDFRWYRTLKYLYSVLLINKRHDMFLIINFTGLCRENWVLLGNSVMPKKIATEIRECDKTQHRDFDVVNGHPSML